MGNGRVKVCCHTCDGTGEVPEKAYPSGESIKVRCPECDGDKYVYAVEK